MTDYRRRTLLRHLFVTATVVVAGASGAAHREALPPSSEPEFESKGDSQERINHLVIQAHELLTRLNAPELQSFLEDWPTGSARRSPMPSTIPALRWLTQIHELAPKFAASFVDAVVAGAPSLAWRRSYSPALVGATFFENYGWAELAGLTGPVPSEHLACGLLLLGPHRSYPPHRHEAEEVYVPLVGMAAWKHGSDHWRERSPGTVIHHAPNEPHAMRTGASPMLALYLWRSENLAQESRLDPVPSRT